MKKQVVCKSCGCVFTLTQNQLQFYADKGKCAPKHCVPCRKKSSARHPISRRKVDIFKTSLPDNFREVSYKVKKERQEREDPYYGIYEAMENYTPLKKRKQRVYYAPHIVGGFR
ncbi:MAG: zinc-ribbon domain containing protein [Acutalibacteraceae bacterium]